MASGDPSNKKPTLPDLSAEMTELLDELNREPSDRARAILVCAYIEDVLASMLRARLCAESISYNGNPRTPLDEIVGRLQFGGKLDLCFCLGLVGREGYHDLKIIEAVRNRFAHRRSRLTFADPSMQSQIGLLKTPGILEGPTRVQFPPGDRFLTGAVMLLSQLMLNGLPQTPIPVGKDFHIVQRASL